MNRGAIAGDDGVAYGDLPHLGDRPDSFSPAGGRMIGLLVGLMTPAVGREQQKWVVLINSGWSDRDVLVSCPSDSGADYI